MEEACKDATHCIYNQETCAMEEDTGIENEGMALLETFGYDLI